MNQMHRNRIWKMVIRSLGDKTGLMEPKEDESRNQVIDPDEILKGFKEYIEETGTRD